MPDSASVNGKTVTCLGGTGGMGSTLAHYLSQAPGVGRLVIADLDGQSAAHFAAELATDASCEVVGVAADALDEQSMAHLLENSDFLANAAGPFFRLGVPTLRAAIAAGTPYLDICDDPEPTMDMLALGEDAKAAGVAALIGMGASPGVSNLMARRAANRLDEVTDCFTAWPLDVEGPGGDAPLGEAANHQVSAAAIHLMEQISGSIHTVVAGELTQARPLESVTLDYPGLGTGSALTVGHPEPVTLYRSLNVQGRATNLMLVKRSTEPFIRALAADIDKGRLTLIQAADELQRPSLARSAVAAIKALRVQGPGELPPFFVLLTGRKDGERMAVGCAATAMPRGMDGATAIPAGIAVEMLLENPAPPGVHAPEDIIDPEVFFERLKPYCSEPRIDVDDLVPINEEPLD